MDGYFPELGSGALRVLDELDADRSAVAAQRDALDDRAADKAEVAVYIVDWQPERPPHQKPVDAADVDPVHRILTRHLDAVDEMRVGGQQHQQDRELTDVVLSVTVGVENEVLGRRGESAPQRRP